MKLRNNTYNSLKFVALVLLPAAGSAYFAIAGVWHLPHADQVVGTITIIDTFLGALLHVSTKSYTLAKPVIDGKLIVDTSNPAKDVYRFALLTPLSELNNKEHVTLKVEPGSTIQAMTTKP